MKLIPFIAAVSILCGCSTTGVQAQTAKDVVGTWSLVSNTADEPGKPKVDTYGANPLGIMILTADGHYAIIVMRADLPKIASNNRVTATPEEAGIIARGSLTHFGTYTVDESGKALVFHIVASTFSNWNGVEQRRPFSIAGGELTYLAPGSTNVATKVVYRRAR